MRVAEDGELDVEGGGGGGCEAKHLGKGVV